MKLPKIFIPKKSLEEKTKQLLEKPLNKPKNDPERHGQLYEGLRTEFPKFTEYLFNLYPNLGIFKVKDKKGLDAWKFFVPYSKKNSKAPYLVSQIGCYVEQCNKDMSEYGHHVKVLIDGNWHLLKHRIGRYCFDSPNKVVSTKDPLRHDKENIPFP